MNMKTFLLTIMLVCVMCIPTYAQAPKPDVFVTKPDSDAVKAFAINLSKEMARITTEHATQPADGISFRIIQGEVEKYLDKQVADGVASSYDVLITNEIVQKATGSYQIMIFVRLPNFKPHDTMVMVYDGVVGLTK